MIYQTVLFDLDGTLIESGPAIIASARKVMRDMGVADLPDEQMKRMIGPPLADCFRDVIGIPPERVGEAVERYREHARLDGPANMKPYPGIPELMSELKARGATVGVVTSKITPTAKSQLQALGLIEYTDYVRGGFPGGSADKLELVTMARDELPGVVETKVMVGDRRFDLEAAAKAGLPSIGVLYGYGSAEEISMCRPTYTVKSVAELSALLIN